jgi:hypothetical protein
MMTKLGINTVSSRKRGPNIKESICIESPKRSLKTITCSCGKQFEKNCPNEEMCDVSSFECPYCNQRIS